jgi:hypothetical protein
MSTVTTSTNVAIVQRDSSGNNAWVNVLGSANPNKSLGFSSGGAVTALSVPVLSLENTFSALQKVQTTGGELLRLTRGGGSIDGEGQELRLLCGVSGSSGSGCAVGHFSLTSSASTAKNYLRLYDDGVSIDNAATDKIIDVNTTLQTVAITSTLHNEGTYGKLHIGGTYLTSLTNSVRALRIDPVATLGEGLATAGIDVIISTAGTFNNDHIAGVQSRPRHGTTGTLARLYSFVSIPVANGGVNDNVYGLFAFDATGSGAVTNQYGLYVSSLTKATNNWGIYTDGTTPSRFGGNITARAFIGTDAAIAAAAIDWATGASFTKTLSASTTFTFANSVPGQQIVVAITNTVANYTVTWPSSPTLKWSGGSAPVQTIGAKTDVYTFVNIGGVIYGSVVQNF